MKKKWKKSFRLFSKFLLSFILIIFFANVCGIVIFSIYIGILEKNVMKANYSALEHLSNQFDAIILDANDIFYQLSIDKTVVPSIMEDAQQQTISYQTIHTIYNRLASLKNENIEDLFVYYINSDRIVSVYHAAFQSEQYFKAYYPQNNFYDTFMGLVNSISFNQIVSFGNQQYQMAVIQTMPMDKFKNYSALVFYVPNKNIVRSLLYATEWNESEIAVFDRNNRLIVTTNPGIRIDMDQFRYGQTYYNDTINGKEFIIQIKSSNATGCKYVSAVPTNKFWNDLNHLRLLSIIFFCLFSTLGLALSFFLSKRNYTPISNMIKYLSDLSDTHFNDKSENEIDFIWKELHRFSSEYKKSSDIVRDDFIEHTLQGFYPTNKNIIEVFHIYGMTVTTDCFSVLLFKIEDWDNTIIPDIYEGNQTPLIEIIMKNVLTELCLQIQQGYVVSIGRDVYACLLNLPAPSKEYPEKIGMQMLDFLRREMGILCTGSYGGCYTGWQGISMSYREALDAIQYSVIVGIGELLPPTVIKNNVFHYNFDSRDIVEKLILTYIKTGESEPDEILSHIKRAYFGREITLPEEYKCYFYDSNDLLHKISYTIGFHQEHLSELSKCKDIKQHNRLVSELLIQMRDYYETNKKENNMELEKLCIKVKYYIDQNYKDSNLGVGTIGEYFDITPSYLSKQFKEYTGISIPDYINTIRIEKAKAMLESAEANVNRVAEKVGFLSSTVFIRVFKKYEGITPGAYGKIYGNAGT